eukprot:6210686-Pleurochrysis_carterae.AAC.7
MALWRGTNSHAFYAFVSVVPHACKRLACLEARSFHGAASPPDVSLRCSPAVPRSLLPRRLSAIARAGAARRMASWATAFAAPTAPTCRRASR